MSTARKGLVEFTLGGGIPTVLEYWAKVIEKTANELCNDPDCKSIQFKIDVKNLSVIIIQGFQNLVTYHRHRQLHRICTLELSVSNIAKRISN